VPPLSPSCAPALPIAFAPEPAYPAAPLPAPAPAPEPACLPSSGTYAATLYPASSYTPPSGYTPAHPQATVETPAHPPSVPPVFAPYATNAPLSRDWYVYQRDGRHLGPLSTDFLARGWVARQIPRDIFVGTAGEASWRPIGQVEEIMGAVRALEAWNQVASAR
jgi:hypothetical protein